MVARKESGGGGLCMCKALANFSAGCKLSAPFLSHDNRNALLTTKHFPKKVASTQGPRWPL